MKNEATAAQTPKTDLIKCQTCGDAGDFRGDSGVKIVSVRRLGLAAVCERCGKAALAANPKPAAAPAPKPRRRTAKDWACQECGRRMTAAAAARAVDQGCTGCGGADIDLA